MKERISSFFSKLKEDWKDPRKKAGIKLLSYFIFFFLLLLIATVSNNIARIKNSNTSTITTTTTQVDKYKDKQKDLLTNKYNISYVININDVEYKINGTIDNNIVSGYLESSSGIKKIIIKDNNIYEIINEEEVILESEININYLDLMYIINLIKENSSIIKDNDGKKVYEYNIDSDNIVVETNETMINKISIKNETSSYILNFDK